MKKFILILLLCIGGNATFSQVNILPPDPSSILVIKYSKTLNGANSFVPNVQIFKENGSKEWQQLYMFFSNADNGRPIDVEFYTVNKNTYAYRDPALFEEVSITNDQLRDILSPKSARTQDEYLRSFQHIFLIDLDSPNRLNPNEFKTILVKPYFSWEHGFGIK